MSALGRSAALSSRAQARSGTARTLIASIYHGRAPPYRRLQHSHAVITRSLRPIASHSFPQDTSLPSLAAIRPAFLPATLHLTSSQPHRSFSSSLSLAAKVGKPPGSESYKEAPQARQPEPQPEPEPTADEPRKASDADGAEPGGARREPGEDGKDGEQQEQQKQEQEQEDAKKQEAPPPPHGDKSPWQVFTETLQSEFKASKEWNDSTKQLGGRIDDFRQNETIKKAREGYSTVTGVAASTTGKVFKTAGKAIGQTAAWTWDTLPVKGLRATARVTGSGLEKMTRPIRQTEAYKSVANVIDDGSSSKYGGWTEKEERRLKREAREEEEIRKGLRPRRTEPMEEDPKYASHCD